MGKKSRTTKDKTTAPVVTPSKPIDLSAFKKIKDAAPVVVAPNLVVATPAGELTEEQRRDLIMKKVEAAKLAALLTATAENMVVPTTTEYTTVEKAAFGAFDRTKPEQNTNFTYEKNEKTYSSNHAGGGAKGKEGNTDHTAGKCQFARPCTVGGKSQNQPLQRGGGGRTPRMKSPAVAK